MNRDDIPGIREADTLADGAETIARATWEATLLTAVELLRNAGIDHGWYSAQRYLADMALAEPVWLTPGGDNTDVRLVHDMGGRTRIAVPRPIDKGSKLGPCAYCHLDLEIGDGGLPIPVRSPEHPDAHHYSECLGRTRGRPHMPYADRPGAPVRAVFTPPKRAGDNPGALIPGEGDVTEEPVARCDNDG